MARESRTSISLGEKLQYAKTVEDIKNRADLNSTKLANDVNSKWSSSEEAKNLWTVSDPKERKKAEIIGKEKLVVEYITSTGGKIVGKPTMEGRTRVYQVEYPDGEKKEVRYAF